MRANCLARKLLTRVLPCAQITPTRAKDNGLMLNPKKTHYKISGTSAQEQRPQIRIHTENCRNVSDCQCQGIQNVTATKYLGTTIDEKLTWKAHLGTMLNKLRAATVTIVKLHKSVTKRTTVTAYRALFESQLRYCALAYMSTFSTSLDRVANIQNALIKRVGKGMKGRPVEHL